MWVTPERPAAMARRQTPFSRTLLSLPGFKSPFLLPAVFIHLNGDKEKPIKHFLKEESVKFSPSEGKTVLRKQNVTEKTNKQETMSERTRWTSRKPSSNSVVGEFGPGVFLGLDGSVL